MKVAIVVMIVIVILVIFVLYVPPLIWPVGGGRVGPL